MDGETGFVLLAMAIPVVLAVSLLYFEADRRSWRAARRQIARAPRIPLAEVAEGALARVVGRTVVLGEVLSAPVTGRACLYYRVSIYETRGRGVRLLFREDAGTRFVLHDETANVIVDSNGSTVALEEERRWRSIPLATFHPRVIELLSRHGMNTNGRYLRYVEAIIGVGATISIVGRAVRDPDPAALPDSAYRGVQPTQVTMTSSARSPLLISDSALTTR